MAGVSLKDYQEDALHRMKNGCILNGGVGSGKSRTSLAYYYTQYGGKINLPFYCQMINPADLYIITTARKRDDHEWDGELANFHLCTDPKLNLYSNTIVVDSWNNITKYVNVSNAFFIFDEQRVIGNGSWSKAFLAIAQKNKWILLSATPGDNWSDYIPVFIANGFFKNRSEFCRKHVVYSRFTKFTKIEKYINTGILIRMRNYILVDMDFQRNTTQNHITIKVKFNEAVYDFASKKRWNPFTNKPMKNASEYCACLRHIVNSDLSRQIETLKILDEHPKAIIFYTYDYELDILREMLNSYPHAEWNGHKHEPIPKEDCWAYLVQYSAGCEGWNCIETDTIIFYSQNYSYKVMKQAAGRIDRLNTPFEQLYYYHLKSNSRIDMAISMALTKKKKFNEKGFAPKFEIDNETEKEEAV